jgi:GT2 family glycosyltransferase
VSGGVTAVVVSKGLDALLDVCLAHLREALARTGAAARHALVVVDNASTFPYDPARFRAAGVHWLRFDVPRSFARACNAGFAARPSDFVLLLNNDVLLAPDALAAMLGALAAEPQAGICGARLLFPDGTLQHGGVVFGAGGRGPYHAGRGRPAHLAPRGVGEFQAVTGACLLARGSLWSQLGGLDESYPFGLEDIDFCLRVRQRGWRVLCVNDVDSLHFESMTPGRVALDGPSRRLFMQRWRGRYTLDG